MWMDAFLSCAMVAVAVLASPVVAILGVPHDTFVALTLLICAVLLAGFGAITGVLLMMRMHLGQYYLPEDLSLPLPPGLSPKLVTSAPGRPALISERPRSA